MIRPIPLLPARLPRLLAAPSLVLWALLAPQHVAAQTLEQGYDAYERGNVAGAVAIWRQLAEAGDGTAQLNLGQLYRMGEGVEADDQEALKWYAMAAEGGSQIARYNLLKMLEEGRVTRAELDRLAPGATPPAAAAGVTGAAATSIIPTTLPTTHAPTPAASNTGATATSRASTSVSQPLQTDLQWLAALPVDARLLQLMGSSDLPALRRFADKYLARTVPRPRILSTHRNGVAWHILLLGPYDNHEQARAALKQLPSPLRDSKPWVREAATVQALVTRP